MKDFTIELNSETPVRLLDYAFSGAETITVSKDPSIYVDMQSGDDSTGTIELPLRTIDAALAIANVGDIIGVKSAYIQESSMKEEALPNSDGIAPSEPHVFSGFSIDVTDLRSPDIQGEPTDEDAAEARVLAAANSVRAILKALPCEQERVEALSIASRLTTLAYRTHLGLTKENA